MNILFCIHDFRQDNLGLQPWLTIYQISKNMVKMGQNVSVITDVIEAADIAGVHIYYVQSLRGSNSIQVSQKIREISPDIAIISVSPLSLVTSGWFAELGSMTAYAFLSYSFYRFSEILTAFKQLNLSDKVSYGRHLLIPKLVWKYNLSKYFDGAFCQSVRTGRRVTLEKRKDFKVYSILPGLDEKRWYPSKARGSETRETIFLYAGSPKRIRGFNLILDSFAMLKTNSAKLRVLARGADEEKVAEINKTIDQRNLKYQVEVLGGWISQDDLREHISMADVVLLPFILVPSELPVTVMEAIACGTPVIVSDIDGLPEAAGDCGLVVRQADSTHLSKTMMKFHSDKALRNQLEKNCKRKYETMVSWEDTTQKWLDILESSFA